MGSIHIKESHKGLLHKKLGVDKGDKIPVSKLKVKSTDNSTTKKQKIFAQNARKWNKKEDGTKDLTYNKGCKYKMKSGTRQIETEGREPVFTEDGKLISYNPNEPTHKEGGVNAIVVPKDRYSDYSLKLHNSTSKTKIFPEGSSIITAEKGLNIEALNAYSKGDKAKLNKIINSMPKDGKMKYRNGGKLGYKDYGTSRNGGDYFDINNIQTIDDTKYNPVGFPLPTNIINPNPIKQSSLLAKNANKIGAFADNKAVNNETLLNKDTTGNNLNNLASGLVSTIGSIGSVYGATAPIWRNAQLGKQKAELTKRPYLNKIQLNDNYNIQPQLNNVYNSYKNQLGFVNDRTGTIQNRRALSQSALNNKTNQTNEILAQKANYINDLNNRQVMTNSDIAAKNLSLKNQYETYDAMNRAKKADATSKAMEEVGAFSGDLSRHLAANKQNTYNQEMYKKYFDTLENNNDLSRYKEVGIKSNKKGVKNLKYKNK